MNRQKIFDPPINRRDTIELIEIANSNKDFWQKEAIKQAREELIKRNISREYEKKVLEEWELARVEIEKSHQKWLLNNEKEKYSIFQFIIIVIITPLILLGRIEYDESVLELKRWNYKIKFRQRLVALMTGVVFYITLISILNLII